MVSPSGDGKLEQRLKILRNRQIGQPEGERLADLFAICGSGVLNVPA